MRSIEELINFAKSAMKNSYAPYSNMHVGAAVLLSNDEIIIGSNVENASFPLTNCAERSALFAVYSQGYTKEDIIALAVAADFPGKCTPCGACRQVMVELMEKDCPVYMISKDNSVVTTTVADLLPMAFDGDQMK